MKSIAQMAKSLDISSSTIREYLSRFEEFFPDPVEHEGIKEYPPETEELVKQIYGYYQNSGMTKEEIRVKLGGPAPADPNAAPVSMSPMDSAMFKDLTDKFDQLITTIENLTSAIMGADIKALKGIRQQTGSNERLNELSEQLSNIMELTRGEESEDENLEQNVLDADGTVVFSFGKLSQNAIDSINFAKAHKKPWIHIDLETEKNSSKVMRKWLSQFEIKVINVAGRSASKIPGLKRSINDLISLALNES